MSNLYPSSAEPVVEAGVLANAFAGTAGIGHNKAPRPTPISARNITDAFVKVGMYECLDGTRIPFEPTEIEDIAGIKQLVIGRCETVLASGKIGHVDITKSDQIAGLARLKTGAYTELACRR